MSVAIKVFTTLLVRTDERVRAARVACCVEDHRLAALTLLGRVEHVSEWLEIE